MRRRTSRPTSLLLSLVVVPVGMVAAPVVSRPAAEPRPVEPQVQHIELPGVVTTASTAGGSGPRTVAAIAPTSTTVFSTLGVTWRPDPLIGEVHVSARTRTDGGWSDWRELEEEEGTAAPGGTGRGVLARAGTEPAWVGPSNGVQVRVLVDSGNAPTDLRLSLVDPGTSSADAAVAPTLGSSYAEAATAQPTIHSRSAWGADESMRTEAPSYADTIQAVTVHHTASSNEYDPADVPGIIRGFYAFHVQSRGWSDIGYNVLVDKFGNAWEGRAGGLDKPVIGAHAGGFNTGTTGISMIGTYDRAPSSASLETVAQLAAWKLSSYGRDPQGTVTLTSAGSTKYPSGTRVTLPRIFGHSDVSSTGCPGVGGYEALRTIRERAGAIVDSSGQPSAGEPPTSPPPARDDSPFGALESATGDSAGIRMVGYAIDPDATTYTIVGITVDGASAGTMLADQHRSDLPAKHPQYSANHGFSGLVPALSGARTVCAVARNQGAGGDRSLGCQSVTVPAAAPAPAPAPAPAGAVPKPSTAPPPARATDHSCPEGSVPASRFADAATSVHAKAIDCALWWDLTSGTTATTYSPGNGVSRAQMASFLARLIQRSGGRLPASPSDAFDDDRMTGGHQLAINQLAAVGVVSGKGQRIYDPAGIVTREQMATFLVRAYEYRTGRVMPAGFDYFADDDDSVHEANIDKVARVGFTGGSGDGRFRPTAATDRAQMASFLTRVLDLLVEGGDTPART